MSRHVPLRSHARPGHAGPRISSPGRGEPTAGTRRSRRAAVALALTLAVTATACGGDQDTPAGSPGASGSGAASFHVTASNYPLAWLAARVGGEHVSVTNLTPPGAEPHELELTTDQLSDLRSTDLVLTLTGFQPAVDEAVAQLPAERIVQPTAGVTLLAAEDHGHADEAGADAHTELAGGKDPHVWLDPSRFATMAGNVAAEFSRRDPAHADAYTANAATLTGELTALDTAWRAGTKTCANRDLVVSHEAFGYLADAYDFEQVGITGLAPDSEPNPKQLAEIITAVRDRGVRSVYSEALVDPRIAQTVAEEAGAQVRVLDPVEGIPPGSTDDYLSIMRRNLDTVRAGQPCT